MRPSKLRLITMDIIGLMLNNIVRISIMVMVLVCTASAQTAVPQDKATEMFSTSSNRYGSSGGVQSNAFSPTMSNNTPMTTIDGSKTFNAQMFCPSSSKMVQITILQGGTGDISNLYVQQDTDFDGNLDWTYSAPFPVSGVCGNGVIACSAGTWSGCNAWRWKANMGIHTKGEVELEPVGMGDLGSCYCVNNFCGSNLVMLQLSSVLMSLGAGVTNAYHAVYPQQAISSASIDNLSVTYYGQSSSACSSSSFLGSGSSLPSQYFSKGSSAGLDNAAASATSVEVSNPNSTYSVILTSNAAQSQQYNTKSCSIRRNVAIDSVSAAPLFTWQPWVEIWINNDCCGGHNKYFNRIDINRDGVFEAVDSRDAFDNAFPWSNLLSVYDGYAQTFILQYQATYSVPSTEIRKSTSPISGVTGCNPISNPVVDGTPFFCYGDGGGSGNGGNWSYYRQYWERRSEPVCDPGYIYSPGTMMCYDESVSENVVDGCSSIETDVNCRMKEETIDGVRTVANYNPTGLVPLASSKHFSGNVLSIDMSYPWWIKDRVYACTTGAGWDWSDAKRRISNIDSTVTDNGSNIYYQDLNKSSAGMWSYSDGQIAIDTSGNSPTCAKACKTRKPKDNTQAGVIGTTTNYLSNTASYEFFYRLCDLNDTCPLTAGEEMMVECKCQSDFGSAAGSMATVFQAGKDMICSSGTTTTTP